LFGFTSDFEEGKPGMKDTGSSSFSSKAVKVVLAVVAMFAVTVAGPQTSSAATADRSADSVAVVAAPASGTDVGIQYYIVCGPPTYYTNAVSRVCTVYSGYIRQFIDCSNGWRYWGPWVGVGTWRLTNICPYPYYRVGSGLQPSN
jgi:hypothetical protein